MKYPCLITTDIHLVDSPSAEYRWELFPWINEQIRKYDVRSLRILGDITDAKDNHPASLVNRIVAGLRALHCDDIGILSGNHDWLLKGHEFFQFLNFVPNIKFMTSVTEDHTVAFGEQCIFLPFTKTPGQDWKDIDFAHYDYAFMHQTVRGALASNGQRMDGEGVPDMPVRRKVYSGDIHVPQDIGNVTYIGSPYHVHFGDDFEPRVLILERGGKERWITMPSPKRVVVKVSSLKALERYDLIAGDQVKLRMQLGPEDRHAWSRIKREAGAILRDRGVLAHGIEMVLDSKATVQARKDLAQASTSPEDLVYRFVNREEWGGDAYQAAMDIIES